MRHTTRVRPALFCRITDGSKNFLVVENDTGFQMGDTVLIQEFDWNPVNATSNSPLGLTGNELEFSVGFVLPLEDVSHRVVLSLLPIKTKSK
jgi:hypothetical protein